MGSKKSISESSKMTHDDSNMSTWSKEHPSEIVRDDEDAVLDDVFSEFPQNEPCIQLFRVNSQGGRPLFLEQLAPASFSLAYVLGRYGGGRYQAKGRYSDGQKVRMPFEIEGEPIPAKRVSVNYNNPPSVHEPVLPRPVQPLDRSFDVQGSGADTQGLILGMLKQLIQEMRGSEAAMLEKMKLYKELFSAPQQREAPIDQAINMFTRGVELAGMQGGGDGPNFWMMALKELREPLSKIVDTIQVAVTQSKAPVMVPGHTGGAPVGGPVSVMAQPSGQEEAMIKMLRLVMPNLINGAARNADPSIYADFLLDQVPESAYPSLREWIGKPDCLDKLALVEPGIRFQSEWWVSLRQELLNALNEDVGGHGSSAVQSESYNLPATGASADSQNLS